MAQVLEFKLPDLGEGLTEAEIVGWLVAVGDVVAVDQPVVEVETAKARVEVPCPYGGVVTARFGEEGTELPVGAPLMTVAVGGDAAGGGEAPVAGAAPLDESAGGASAGGASGAAEGDTSGNVLVGYGTAAPSARRRRVAPVLLVETAPVNGSATPAGPAGGVDGVRVKSPSANGEAANRPAVGGSAVDRPVAGVPAGSASVPAGPVPVVSPLVRRLARQHGLDLRQLTGSGRQGLILRTDVERAIERVATPAAVPAATAPRPPRRTAPSGCRSRAYGAPSRTRCPAAARRSPRRPAGWTPTRRN